MKSVVIITPTTGSEDLKQCMESVQKQTYPNVRHLIVIDGNEANLNFVTHSDETLISYIYKQDNFDLNHIDFMILPQNVGSDNFYGHRVYAAIPYLVNEDIVM